MNHRLERGLIAATIVAGGLCLSAAVGQTTYDWKDTAPDGNWKRGADGARWWPGDLWDEPPANSILRFNNNHRPSMNNNVAAGYVIHQIIFGSLGGDGRTISGNSVVMTNNNGDAKIENLNGGSHSIGLAITADTGSNDLQINPVNGSLTFTGTVDNNGNKIEVYGGTSKVLEFRGALNGSGDLDIDPADSRGTHVKVFGSGNFSGDVHVHQGEFWLAEGGVIGSGGTVNVGDGSGSPWNIRTAKLWISDADGGTVLSNAVQVQSGDSGYRVIGGLNTSGTNTFTGMVTLNTAVNLEAQQSGGCIEFTNVISGSQNVTLNGAGKVRLTGANTFSGALYIDSGTLELARASGDPLGVSEIKLGYQAGDVRLQLDSSSGFTLDNQINVRSTSGTKSIRNVAGSNTCSGSIYMDADLLVTNSAGTLVLSGSDVDLKQKVLTVTGLGTTEIGGVLKNSQGSGDQYVLKQGGGTLIGSGNGVFGGGIYVDQGTLRLDHNSGIGSGTIRIGKTDSSALDAKLLLKGGRTVSNTIDVRQPNSGVMTIAVEDTNESTLTGNIYLYKTVILDVSEATGKLTLQNGVVSQSGGITKTGPGTVELLGANTYQGATIVSNGVVIYNGTNTSSDITIEPAGTLKGAGSVGGLAVEGTVGAGAAVGTLSVTNLTLAGGGTNVIEVGDLAAGITPGVHWDLIEVNGGSGETEVTATSGNKHTFLLATNYLANFSNNLEYSWRVIDGGTVTSFETNRFTIDSSDWPPLGGGTFFLTSVGGDIYLNFGPPPNYDATWDGGASSNEWSGGGNWDDDIAPDPSGNTILRFEGGTDPVNTNDFTVGSDFEDIIFSNTTASFSLYGNGIDWFGDIINNSPNTHTVALDYLNVSNGAADVYLNSNDLSFTTGVISNNGNDLRLYGNNGHTLTLSVDMEGSGGLSVEQNSTALVAVAQSYSGDTWIKAGGVAVGPNGTLASDVKLGVTGVDTAASFVVEDSDGGTTVDDAVEVRASADAQYRIIGSANTSGTNTFAGIVTLEGDVTLSASGSGGTVEFSNAVKKGAAAHDATIRGPGVVVLSGGSGTDNEALGVAVESGTLVLAKSHNDARSFGQDSTVAGGATMRLGGSDDFQIWKDADVTVSSGGVFDMAGRDEEWASGDGGGGGGALTIQGAGAGSGALVNSVAGVTNTLGAPVTLAATATVGGAGGLALNSAVTGQAGGTILTKTGNGVLILGGADDNLDLALTVTEGTVVLNKDSGGGKKAVGSGLVINGGLARLSGADGDQIYDETYVSINNGMFDLNERDETIGTLNGTGGFITNSASGGSTLTVDDGGTFAGTITESSGQITLKKGDNGTLTLSGDNSGSSYTLELAKGQVVLTNANSLGTCAADKIRFSGDSTLRVSTALATAGLGIQYSGTPTATLDVDSGVTFTVPGVISNAGATVKNGDGTLRFEGSGDNTYGTTIVNDGSLILAKSAGANAVPGWLTVGGGGVVQLEAANQIIDTSFVTLNGALDLNGHDDAFALQGSGSLTLGGGNLTITNTGAGDDFSGMISESGTVAKRGAGTQILSGANQYTGATTVEDGTLLAAHNSALGTVAGGVTVSNGAKLGLSGGITVGAEALSLDGDAPALESASGDNTWQGQVTLAGDARVNSAFGSELTLEGIVDLDGNTLYVGGDGDTTVGGTLTNGGKSASNGALYKDGGGALTLSGANGDGLTGTVNLVQGTLLAGHDSALAAGGTLVFSGGATLAAADGATRVIAKNTTVNGDIDLGQSGGGTGRMDLRGPMALGGGTRILTVLNPTNEISGNISGGSGVGFVKRGAGTTLVLNGNNTFPGGLYIDAGTVTLDGGSLAASVLDIGTTTGGQTDFAAALRLSVLSGQTVTQPVTVKTGGARDLFIENTSGLTELTAAMTLDKTLTVTKSGGADTLGEISGAIGGSGGLTKAGDGILELSSISSYSGLTTVSDGTLRHSGANTSSDVAVGSGATLRGTGSVGGATVNSGGAIAAGANEGDIGTLTAQSLTLNGGTNVVEFGDVTLPGTAGTHWDLIDASAGEISVPAGSGEVTLLLDGSLMSNFQKRYVYAWKIVDGATLNANYSAGDFTLVTNGWPDAGGGDFSVTNRGADIYVDFSPHGGSRFIWNGDSEVDSNWMTSTNWVSDLVPQATAATRLIFIGGARTTTTNNFAAGSSLADLVFSNTSAPFTLVGNGIDWYGDIVNDGTHTQAISLDFIDMQGASGDVIINGGGLTFNGGTITNNGNDLHLYGTNGNTLTLAAELKGSGKLIVEEDSICKITTAQSFTGYVEIDEGAVHLDSGASLATDRIYVGNGEQLTDSAAFLITDTDGGTTNMRPVTVHNANDASYRTLGGANTSGTNVFSAAVTLAGPVQLTAAAGGNVRFAAAVNNNQAIAKIGAGTVTVDETVGSQSITIGNGVLRLGAAHKLDDSASVTIASGAALDLGGYAERVAAIFGAGNITNLNAQSFVGSDSVSSVFSGGISGSSSLVKDGSQSLSLGGVSTYAGGTFIDRGALILTNGAIAGTGTIEVGSDDHQGWSAELQLNAATGGQFVANHIVIRDSNDDNVDRAFASLNSSGTNTLGGTVTHTNDNNQLRIYQTSGGTLHLTNVVSGAGDIRMDNTAATEGGRLLLSASNTFSGDLEIDNGMVELRHAYAAGTSGIYLGSFNDVDRDATLTIGAGLTVSNTVTSRPTDGDIVTIATDDGSGDVTLSGSVKLTKDGDVGAATRATYLENNLASGSLIIHEIDLEANGTDENRIIYVDGDITLQGVVDPPTLDDHHGLVMRLKNNADEGVLRLENSLNANFYLDSGDVVWGTNFTLGASVTEFQVGTTDNDAEADESCSVSFENPGSYDVDMIVGFLNPTVGDTGTRELSFEHSSGTIALAGDIVLTNDAAGKELVLTTTEPVVILEGGTIEGEAGIRKQGPGILTFSGTAGYEGDTYVDHGSLKLANFTELGGGLGNIYLGTNGYNAALYIGAGKTSDVPVIVQAGSGTRTIGTDEAGGSASVYASNITVNKATQFNALGSMRVIFDSAGAISGSGGVTKVGAGTVVFRGANVYTGGTIISNGTLLADNTAGSGTGSGSVDVNNGGTLGGTGSIAGALTVNNGGTLAPGTNALGVLSLGGGVTFSSGSTFEVSVKSATAGGYGQAHVTSGDVALGDGTATLSLDASGYAGGNAEMLWIVNNTGAGTTTGYFSGCPADSPFLANGNLFFIRYDADFDTRLPSGGNDILLMSAPAGDGILFEIE